MLEKLDAATVCLGIATGVGTVATLVLSRVTLKLLDVISTILERQEEERRKHK